MSDLADLGIAGALAGLRARQFSAVELLDACLARIAAWNEATNAFIDLRAGPARIAAAEAGAARAAGEEAPLLGIPLAHKDMFYRAGRVSTCGSVLRRDWRADTTATVLRRLDAAGAIDLGTLNMSEWAAGATGHNPWFGDACNPWDPARITGGSSSGAGAAVATRMVFGALGSDTGGSIRLPAACCGVTGLKPGWGVVSRFGAMPRAWSLDCIGPLARSAADCAALFAAIAGADPDDPATIGVSGCSVAQAAEDLRGVVIGVEGTMLAAADPAIRPALDAALALLAGLGAELREVAIPDLARLNDIGGLIAGTEAASLHLEQMRDHPECYAPDLLARGQAGLATPAVLYLQALRERGPLLARMRASVFGVCDALFAPTLTLPVPTREATRTRSAEDVARLHGPMIRLTRPFSCLGLPVLALPCGFDAAGLPVGFQLAGPPAAETRLLGIGMAFERAAGWHLRAPSPASAVG